MCGYLHIVAAPGTWIVVFDLDIVMPVPHDFPSVIQYTYAENQI